MFSYDRNNSPPSAVEVTSHIGNPLLNIHDR